MGRFSRGGSFIPEERACFLPLDFAVVAGGKAVGGVGFVLGTDVERFLSLIHISEPTRPY